MPHATFFPNLPHGQRKQVGLRGAGGDLAVLVAVALALAAIEPSSVEIEVDT